LAVGGWVSRRPGPHGALRLKSKGQGRRPKGRRRPSKEPLADRRPRPSACPMCARRFSRRMHGVGCIAARSCKHHISRRSLMKSRRYLSPSFVLSLVALFVALGGGAAVAATQFVNNAGHLGGKSPSYYLAAKHFVSSGGEKFLHVGQTEVLGHAGHFTFS